MTNNQYQHMVECNKRYVYFQDGRGNQESTALCVCKLKDLHV